MHSDSYHSFMLDHAAGTLSPAMNLAGDLHVALSTDGQSVSDLWDSVAGALLERELGLDNPARSKRRRLRAQGTSCEVTDILYQDLEELPWRRGLSGVHQARLDVKGAHFMRLDPGQTVPRHGHSALEATVVMQGVLDVDGTAYHVGDLVLGVPGHAHRPSARGDEACVCFVAREPRPFWRFT